MAIHQCGGWQYDDGGNGFRQILQTRTSILRAAITASIHPMSASAAGWHSTYHHGLTITSSTSVTGCLRNGRQDVFTLTAATGAAGERDKCFGQHHDACRIQAHAARRYGRKLRQHRQVDIDRHLSLDTGVQRPDSKLPGRNTCSLIYPGSGFCTVRPAAYLGGAGTNYSNSTFEKPLATSEWPDHLFQDPHAHDERIPRRPDSIATLSEDHGIPPSTLPLLRRSDSHTCQCSAKPQSWIFAQLLQSFQPCEFRCAP